MQMDMIGESVSNVEIEKIEVREQAGQSTTIRRGRSEACPPALLLDLDFNICFSTTSRNQDDAREFEWDVEFPIPHGDAGCIDGGRADIIGDLVVAVYLSTVDVDLICYRTDVTITPDTELAATIIVRFEPHLNHVDRVVLLRHGDGSGAAATGRGIAHRQFELQAVTSAGSHVWHGEGSNLLASVHNRNGGSDYLLPHVGESGLGRDRFEGHRFAHDCGHSRGSRDRHWQSGNWLGSHWISDDWIGSDWSNCISLDRLEDIADQFHCFGSSATFRR